MDTEALIDLLLDEDFEVTPTLEEELAREKQILEVRECTNPQYVKNLCIELIRQNQSQAKFIASTLERLAYFHSKEKERAQKQDNKKGLFSFLNFCKP